jgi:hypothetical protein
MMPALWSLLVLSLTLMRLLLIYTSLQAAISASSYLCCARNPRIKDTEKRRGWFGEITNSITLTITPSQTTHTNKQSFHNIFLFFFYYSFPLIFSFPFHIFFILLLPFTHGLT